MLTLDASNLFLRDLKRAKKRNKDLIKLHSVIDLLLSEKVLPIKFKDHQLRQYGRGTRELHIEPDWLLVYRIDSGYLRLMRTGSHTDIFDKQRKL